MMNILLAEDEPPILRDLKGLIESFSTEYKVSLTATDGKQALECLKQNTDVDLLITDIQMPVINGLDLIESVLKIHPGLPIIIITGFSDFEYAKRAINLGVHDYILKPVDEEELRTQLQTLYCGICRAQLERSVKSFGLSPKEDSRPKSRYVLVELCAGTFPILSSSLPTFVQDPMPRNQLEQILEVAMSEKGLFWVIEGKASGEKIIIFTFQSEDEQQIRLVMESLFHQLCEHFAPLTMAVDLDVNGMGQVGPSAKCMRTLVGKSLVLGESRLLFQKDELPQYVDSDLTKIEKSIENLTYLFGELNITAFYKGLTELITHMEGMHLCQNLTAKYLYMLENGCIAQCTKLGLSKNENFGTVAADAVALSDSFATLKQNMLDSFQSLFEWVANRPGTHMGKEQSMIQLDAFLRTHYNQPLITNGIAVQFGFTPTYLSKLFRNYKNMTPSEYIVHLRIQKAQELFSANPDILIKDVSNAVGYEDPLYFSKVFKKVTGKTPTEFCFKING